MDLQPQFSDTFDADRFAMVFMAVNGKQQIGDKACKDLYRQAVWASCNQVVDAQVAFQPGKEVFYVPSKLIYFSDLFGLQVPTVRCYSVIDTVDTVSDQPYRLQ